MKTIGSTLALSVISCATSLAYTNLGNNVFRTNGTASDTQSAINAASNGYTIQIPAGTFGWTSSVDTGSKAVTIVGAGAGGFRGHSTTSHTIGTGTKTFATQAGLSLQSGQTVRAIYTPDGNRFMEGTVTSYSGTSLTLSIANSGGSGTGAAWTFAIPAQTEIINNISGASALYLNRSNSGIVELSGICFRGGSGNDSNTDHITIGGSGAQIFRIFDCWFSANGSMGRAIECQTIGGLVYRCSFDSEFGLATVAQGVGLKAAGSGYSWTTASTMGTNDTTGTNNTYFEDCHFAGISGQTFDFDDNSRTVVRYCIFNNSSLTSHGQDTSAFGNRHCEIYNNEFVFSNLGEDTYNITKWLFLRGGTIVFTNNIMPNLISGRWGDKPELKFTVMNLRRSGGPNGCWNGGWPAPRQIGQGHNGVSTILEPVYIWNNTGGGVQDPSLEDFAPDECGGGPPVSDYIKAGRDYIVGTPKPGYTKYPYPHPLRTGESTPNPPSAPENLRVVGAGNAP